MDIGIMIITSVALLTSCICIHQHFIIKDLRDQIPEYDPDDPVRAAVQAFGDAVAIVGLGDDWILEDYTDPNGDKKYRWIKEVEYEEQGGYLNGFSLTVNEVAYIQERRQEYLEAQLMEVSNKALENKLNLQIRETE